MSGFLEASLKPIKVITDDAASVILLTASATMAILPKIKPTIALPKANNRFNTMPQAPPTAPRRNRLSYSERTLLSTKSLIISLVNSLAPQIFFTILSPRIQFINLTVDILYSDFMEIISILRVFPYILYQIKTFHKKGGLIIFISFGLCRRNFCIRRILYRGILIQSSESL